jgi:thiol-disulfide isomerase/thioredoxin
MKFTKFFALVAATVAMFAACTPGGDVTTATGDITLSAETVVEVNTPIHFVVKDSSGANVTNGATIYDKSHDFAQVENPFTPTMDGDYTFYAVVGDAISKDFKVTVTPEVPALPEDTDAANTSFKHRILLVDHTGNTCGYCPRMMKALKEIEESGDFDGKYYEAMSHSFANTDPAFSGAAASISSHYGLQGYPTLTYNFYHPTSSSYNAEHIKGQINALWKESADAGIAASTNLAAKSVVVNAEVKAAVDGEYSITAWLLEDGIYAKQTNATAEWMNTHNNAIRQAATTSPLTGYELGALKPGETAEQILNLTIARDTWNRDNMKVMLIVSKKGDNKKFDVANVVICPINDSVTYDYK